MMQFDEQIFQMGWFNHQLVNIILIHFDLDGFKSKLQKLTPRFGEDESHVDSCFSFKKRWQKTRISKDAGFWCRPRQRHTIIFYGESNILDVFEVIVYFVPCGQLPSNHHLGEYFWIFCPSMEQANQRHGYGRFTSIDLAPYLT